MRHKKLNKRFGRSRSERKQLLNSIIRNLFLSYRIETTLEKAKEARKLAEKLITVAKRSTLSDIRAIYRILQDRGLTKKLTKQIAVLFKERQSGYTRIIRTGFRRGDGAPLAVLELIEKPVVEAKPKKEKKPKKEPTPAEPAKEEKRPEAKPVKEKKEPLKKEPAQPKPQKPKPEKPKAAPKPEEVKKPKEEKPLPEKKAPEKPAPEKKGLFDRFKGFFKKDQK